MNPKKRKKMANKLRLEAIVREEEEAKKVVEVLPLPFETPNEEKEIIIEEEKVEEPKEVIKSIDETLKEIEREEKEIRKFTKTKKKG